jgi:hypothetical protein
MDPDEATPRGEDPTMDERIRDLLREITRLEDELEVALHDQQTEVLFRFEGTRVRFEERIREAHRRLKMGLLPWILDSSVSNLLSAPFIYSLILPFLLLDAWLWMYQAVCFPLYRIPRVRRESYIAIDRHQLAYLNSIEKLNCAYCGYANGLLAYAREIASRTEQYWCPIKHARRVFGTHRRYAGFSDFGDSDDHQARLERYRESSREKRR